MCGIVGYIGKRQALPIGLAGLETLEYRGYDSAGFAICNPGRVTLVKQVGYVQQLKDKIENQNIAGNLCILHTRWATHGTPNEVNAHPHHDCAGRVYLVHNGIIENYKELKNYLGQRGHAFISETDTEVMPHLIEELLKDENDFKTALFNALKMIEGTYAFAIINKEDPHTLYAARLSSPLVIGVGNEENFLASDPSALIESTRKVIYLKDGEVAEMTKDSIVITDLDQRPTPLKVEQLEWTLEQAQKGRLKPREHLVKLGGLELAQKRLNAMRRLIILACGTSYYAGLVGEYIFEEIAGIPTEVHFASEFRYREEPFEPGTVALAISQSGETADTLAALRKAKKAGLLTLGLVNVVGSTIARETDAGVYNHAGPEIGVASTKAFLSQLTTLILMALYVSKKRGAFHTALMQELMEIPKKIQSILDASEQIQQLAATYATHSNFLFLGRRYNYPVALEGALKLKEISYIHAEGYGAGEMKHGPIAMVGPDFPTIAVVPSNSVSDKMYSNIQEIKARRGPMIAVATEGDEHISSLADHVLYIPKTLEPLEPLLSIVPLQLFAYYMGTKRGYNVDRPRNLAKSVTVE